ncbi:4-(cytidine 5'-diphospho)-2-C-methyl-D-erythritol kinase [Iamia sp. SCSIO 61187]|uniref:4-(cytidine 5'-diphospho)-2-C-methyl-D-erythritol kinase n=1 Tax=Iamia sp. SCSIO 61187 TaxID=2722752 RepID=UPI001C627F82|nr:4-(cytidine 5'-diphospho)-2-C-methyl-D-erythritol kinase [Iamia sp. SCSIO 61187]QYG93861.1 4-(cytidine 5'-diphospho)-2-C-methyl-D-erythritol kinase [Iamia sp. SCSIO 61187]
MPDVITAPAKLTLSLRVTGVRDDGFHLVDAVMVSLDLADTLTFGPGDDLTVEEASTGLPVPATDDNLVRRALVAVGRRASVHLVKRIPAGGGLGGGSADAAAVLRWAGRADDVDLAAGLGADVPFCLRGGRARVTGIGEVLDPLPPEDATFTLVVPPFGCSTPAVYAAWDELGGPTAAGPNDLEPAALVVEPRLAAWRDALGGATGEVPVLAGSGSTWFVPGAHPGPDRLVVRTTPPLG